MKNFEKQARRNLKSQACTNFDLKRKFHRTMFLENLVQIRISKKNFQARFSACIRNTHSLLQ